MINNLRNEISFLSYDAIDAQASLLLNEYDSHIIKEIQESPLELIIESHTDYDLDFQYLSNNQFYLGRTIFNRGVKLTVTDKEYTMTYDIPFDSPTIVIEQSLIDKNDIRSRFTLAHELGHAVLHEKIFYENSDQRTLFDPAPYELNQLYTPLTKDDIAKARNIDVRNKNFTDHDWIEWQANTFASCVLIPKKSLLNFYKFYNKDYESFIQETAKIFNTSYLAAKFRVDNLKLFYNQRR